MKKIFISVFIFLILFTLLLPTLISTSIGVKVLNHYLSKDDLKFHLDKLSLAWLGEQSLENLHITTKTIDLTVNSIIIKNPLWNLLENPSIFIQQPDLTYQYQETSSSSLKAPLLPNLSLTVEKGRCQIIPKDGTKPSIYIENIDIEVSGSKAFCHADTLEKGNRGLIDIQSTLALDDSIEIQGVLERFPTKFFQILPRLANFPILIFGQSFNARFYYSKEAAELEIASNQANLSFFGKIEDGNIKLKKPLQARFNLTADLSKAIMEKTSFDLISMQDPVKIWVSPEGVSIPLHDLSLKNINIPVGYVDIGRAVFLDKDNLAQILSLLNYQPKKKNTIPIWVQSAPFHLQNGILKLQRTEFLLDNRYEFATWGIIDFNKQNGYASIYVGVTSQALKQLYDFKNLPSSYVLLIPLKGYLENVEVQKKEPAKQLALLLAREMHPIGGLVPPDLTNSVEIPAPRKPFPWSY